MNSLQVIRPYRVCRVSKARIDGKNIILEGDDYNKVKYVLINGVETTKISLQGNRLYVELPKGLTLKDIKSIFPIAETATLSGDTLLSMSAGPDIRPLSGLARLIQLFVKVLFTNQGSSRFNPEIGGNMARILERGKSLNRYQEVLPDVLTAISKTEKDIKNMQKSMTLPDEETLISATAGDIIPDPHTGSVSVSIILKTPAGSGKIPLLF
uniref:Uncharacterized protein n=1 Tax=Dictyoglomus turgidum TaxID=513050 RepID=A0A7C3WM82_9BACT